MQGWGQKLGGNAGREQLLRDNAGKFQVLRDNAGKCQELHGNAGKFQELFDNAGHRQFLYSINAGSGQAIRGKRRKWRELCGRIKWILFGEDINTSPAGLLAYYR